MTDRARWEVAQRVALADTQRKVDAVQGAVAHIRVCASSRGGELGVTVDAQGHVQDIRLTTQALQLGKNV
ncbi:YbaB/EbfC family nucleoid-associated protein [Nocardia sp. NPDC050799]|uniref:YbaB/EbfC family nucleoid-associated protein n=1 Tax=Nocardia sp. NPDC050799 TaxID=3154842 RepID=UPI0033C29A3B